MKFSWGVGVGLAVLLSSACAHKSESVFQEQDLPEHSASGLGDSRPRIRGPEQDRCNAKTRKGSALRQACEDARYIAQRYIQKLSTGDRVCLQSGFGEDPGAACLARAKVRDAHPGETLMEISDARPESKWVPHQQHQFWFTDAALLDLYLDEHGY